MIRNFIANLYIQNKTKKSIARTLSSLRSFFKYFLRNNIITLDPMTSISSMKASQYHPISLSQQELEILFNQPNLTSLRGIRDRSIMETLYGLGLRISELTTLSEDDFNFDRMVVKIKGKGKKERILPLTENLLHWIQLTIRLKAAAKIKNNQSIFWGNKGALSTRSIDRMFKKYVQKSGLANGITPHSLRHTAACHWLENGMSIREIQQLLGHISLNSTTIYVHISEKSQRNEYLQSHPRSSTNLEEKSL